MGDRKDIQPHKKPMPLIPKGSVPEKVKKESQGGPADQVHLENDCQQWRRWQCIIYKLNSVKGKQLYG